jgi:hypothetical protein
VALCLDRRFISAYRFNLRWTPVYICYSGVPLCCGCDCCVGSDHGPHHCNTDFSRSVDRAHYSSLCSLKQALITATSFAAGTIANPYPRRNVAAVYGARVGCALCELILAAVGEAALFVHHVRIFLVSMLLIRLLKMLDVLDAGRLLWHRQ